MGAIRDFFFPASTPIKVSDVEASLTPIQIQDNVYQILGGRTTTTRPVAMSVPAVARARNIICGTIGSLPTLYQSSLVVYMVSQYWHTWIQLSQTISPLLAVKESSLLISLLHPSQLMSSLSSLSSGIISPP